MLRFKRQLYPVAQRQATAELTFSIPSDSYIMWRNVCRHVVKKAARMARTPRINVLFTCAGRRVALVERFRRAAAEVGIRSLSVGADANPLSPALFVCDEYVVTRPVDDPGYIRQLLRIVKKHQIRLLVPTIDTELRALAANRATFEALGAKVLVSAPEVIELCQDKRKTYRFLRDHGFGTPRTCTARTCRARDLTFPVFLKPWDGSASKANAVAHDRETFRYFSKRIPNCLVQEHLAGQEYTCDAYVDFEMRVRCVVPRKRIEIRGGEVSKGQTVKLQKLMRECRDLVETLAAGPGVITIQCFFLDDGRIKYIEINPRFGGGVPLSIEAGADFPKWIFQELLGRHLRVRRDGWKNGLCMLRYDHAVWTTRSPGRT